MLSALLAGLGLGLSLIVAIGAQNLFVLRQGLRREHVAAVALVCTVSDVVLIVVGVSGIGLILHAVPWLAVAMRYAGAAFLAVYAVMALRRAWRPTGDALRVDAAAPAAADGSVRAGSASGGDVRGGGVRSGDVRGSSVRAGDVRAGSAHTATATRLAPVLATCLALTWLNPHVYLDTVFLLGSVASTHGDLRWWFAVGAGCASAVWFFSLAYGARLLGRWLSTPRAWRIVDAVIGVVMLLLAANLVAGA
ncbi:LysE/ArgO family amino acid transporter [Microbacterium sp.]|uniref:LysE/ArgO family amino acid transporter n=1 Tax=Microbacterium sp. TaxID=51671 RepID=UPI003A94841A